MWTRAGGGPTENDRQTPRPDANNAEARRTVLALGRYASRRSPLSLIHISAFLHVRIGVIQFARLVSGRGKACIGEDLIRGIEAGEIADLSEDHSTHAVADTGDVYKRQQLEARLFISHAGEPLKRL